MVTPENLIGLTTRSTLPRHRCWFALAHKLGRRAHQITQCPVYIAMRIPNSCRSAVDCCALCRVSLCAVFGRCAQLLGGTTVGCIVSTDSVLQCASVFRAVTTVAYNRMTHHDSATDALARRLISNLTYNLSTVESSLQLPVRLLAASDSECHW